MLPFSEKQRVYFLKSGTIKLIKINGDGEEILIDILQKGDLFGELSLGESADNDSFFKVISSEAIICTFFKENLEDLMLKKPDFALNYIKFIGLNFKQIQNNYKNLLFKDAKTRLLLLFKMLIEKENSSENSFLIPNYLTQKDIAQLICTSRQTVISLLHELEKEGIIIYSNKEISIPNSALINKLTENVK